MFSSIARTTKSLAGIGTRAISSEALKIHVKDEWYKNDPEKRKKLLGNINKDQWEARNLDQTQVTELNITGSGLHTSNDIYEHFTGRAFNNGQAVWFFDTVEKFYTNGIHFYQGKLPENLDAKRFVEVLSDDPELVKWCKEHNRDIKTGQVLKK